MLPSLKRPTHEQVQYQTSQIKLYNPPKEMTPCEYVSQRRLSAISNHNISKLKPKAANQQKADSVCISGKKNVKVNKTNPYYKTYEKMSLEKHPQFRNQDLIKSKPSYTTNPMMGSNLSAEIKLIQKKIRYHKKKLEQQKKIKQLEERVKNNPYDSNFQQIVRKQAQMHGNTQEPKGFDYLTNPGPKLSQQQQPQAQNVQEKPIVQPVPAKKYDLNEKMEKLEKHYQNNLKKKFERRQMFPHYPCRRKTPKLYITHATNALEKFGNKPSSEEHLFRILTKQCTPQEIYPTIPNFGVVKDSLSRNVMAYLNDFKPFIQKSKEHMNDQSENQQYEEQIDVEPNGMSLNQDG